MAAADGVFKSICIFGCDTDVDRRPYHRYCDCALHRSRRSDCARGPPKSKTIAYRMRKSWSEGCLALASATSASSSSSAESSPARSPAVSISSGAVTARSFHRRLSSLDEGDEESTVFLKI